jgi:hypothetical protein
MTDETLKCPWCLDPIDHCQGHSELEIREISHEIGKCRDCEESFPNRLDKFGRCDDCAAEMKERMDGAMGYWPGEDARPTRSGHDAFWG